MPGCMYFGFLAIYGAHAPPDLPCAGRFCDFPAMNDDGFTFLPGGLRVRKSDARIDALGSLDELNAALGLLRAARGGRADAALLEAIQRDVLRIGGELATGKPQLESGAVRALERELERRNAQQPPPQEFILPGGNEISARGHWARAACRRAERAIVRAQESHPERIFPPALAYLNRLSGLLFVLAETRDA